MHIVDGRIILIVGVSAPEPSPIRGEFVGLDLGEVLGRLADDRRVLT
jgi:hypothetical protein